MRYTYDYNGTARNVDVTRQPDGTYQAEIDGQPVTFTAVRLPDGGWMLRLADGQHVGHVAAVDDMRYVHVAGTQYQLSQVNTRTRGRRKGGGSDGDITAEMPGQVIDVRVSAGDTVESGQVLVILEAMKMEIRLTAPVNGTVTAVGVKTGDVVERGQSLVTVQATDDS